MTITKDIFRGYQIFGRAYEFMFRHDLHAYESIDHELLRTMILLNEETCDMLYQPAELPHIETHELYHIAQKFLGTDTKNTICNVLKYTSDIALKYDVDFDAMFFGGTEKQIIKRGTDWCADMARVGTVLLQCLGIPCRILHIVDLDKAYNGHVVGEAYYENHWGVVDFIYGYQFYDEFPLSGDILQKNPMILSNYPESYQGKYKGIAINEYDPMDINNCYTVSTPNQYYLRLIHENHQNQWFMGEDQA